MAALPAGVGDAAAMRITHTQGPALEVLDLMMKWHEGSRVDLAASWLAPGKPFGQVLAASFD